MSSAWTFGRIGLATSAGGDGLELPAHDAAKWDGDTVTLVCDLPQSTVADQLVLRDQFLGYDLNPDERVVPITSANDSTIDGFYVVEEVNVDDRLGTHIAGGEGSIVTVVATKVAGYRAPLFELDCVGKIRSNSHSITTLRGWAGLPPSASLLHGYVGAASAGERTQAGESHTNLLIYDGGIVPDAILRDESVLFAVAPADYYDASAKIEVSSDSGATWRTVTGTQIDNRPTAFRISNDVIRVTHSSSSTFTFAGYLSGWESKNFTVVDGTTSTEVIGAPKSLTVLRNTPERCSVRLWFDYNSGQGAYLDLTVSRAAWWLDAIVATPVNANATFGVFRDATEAATSITAGIQASSVDGSGNKYEFRTPSAVTKVTAGAAGFYLSAASTRLPFQVTYDTLNAAGVFSNEAAYFAGINQRQNVAVR